MSVESISVAAAGVAVLASLVAVAGMLGERRAAEGRRALHQTDARRILTNVPFVIGTLGILLIAFIALFGPQLAPSDPQAQRVIIFYPDASFAAPPTPPDRYNPLGTDPLGRDQLSRLLWGARLTLTVVLLGLLGRALLAIVLGVVAGWRRSSWLDHAIGYVTNAVSGLPQLMLALLLVMAFQGLDLGITGFVLALALVGWAELAQFVRAEVVRVAATPHVEAARTLGATGAHLVRTHILRDLTPQLLGLMALEAGSVLLLLAELGFIGFFIAGGVFYVSDSGAPILPVRDRAPEWGQMLAGARQYAFDHQYVAFIPGVVVVSAVLVFNLFAEGLRTASDPFSDKRLSPRALGGLARTIAAAGLIAAVAFGYVSTTSTHISYDDGLRTAREAAHRVLPGSALVAGVVRFGSAAHALARPSKLTYYFRSPEPFSRILRVTFLDADANALDVKLDANEDGLLVPDLAPLDQRGVVPWERALATAEEVVGTAFRNRNPVYEVRVLLAQDAGSSSPLYRVTYQVPSGQPTEVRIDALTGSASVPLEALQADAESRARVLLGGEPRLVRISATWIVAAASGVIPVDPRARLQDAYGAERPVGYTYTFVRGDIHHPITVAVAYAAGKEGLGSAFQTGSFGGSTDSRTIPSPPFTVRDLIDAFERAEAAGLRERREQWVAEGYRTWQATASSGRSAREIARDAAVGVPPEPKWTIQVGLFAQNAAREGRTATFEYDPATKEITEIPPRFIGGP